MSNAHAPPTFVQDGMRTSFQLVAISLTICPAGFEIYSRNNGGFVNVTISGMLFGPCGCSFSMDVCPISS